MRSAFRPMITKLPRINFECRVGFYQVIRRSAPVTAATAALRHAPRGDRHSGLRAKWETRKKKKGLHKLYGYKHNTVLVRFIAVAKFAYRFMRTIILYVDKEPVPSTEQQSAF